MHSVHTKPQPSYQIREWWVLYREFIVLSAVLFILYVVTMPTQWIVGDPAAEVFKVTSSFSTFRSNHLFLTHFYKMIFFTSHFFGYTGPPFIPLQITNALLGTGCCLLMALIVHYFTKTKLISLICGLVLALSYGYWLHSTTVETGIMPQFFFMLSFFIICSRETDPQQPYIFKIFISSLLFSVSVLLAMNFLALIPFFLLCIFLFSTASFARRIAALCIALVTLIVCIGSSYLFAAFSNQLSTLSEILGWITYHPASERMSLLSVNVFNLARAVSGMLHVFFNLENCTTLLKVLLINVEVKAPEFSLYLKLVLSLLSGSIIMILFLFGTFNQHNKKTMIISWAALFSNLVFCTFTLGSDPQFWLPVTPFIILLFSFGLVGLWKIQWKAVKTITFCAVFFIAAYMLNVNRPVLLPSVLNPDGGEEWKRAHLFSESVNENDLLLYTPPAWGRYLPAFSNPPSSIDLLYEKDYAHVKGEPFLRKLTAAVDEVLSEGGRVFFDDFNGPVHITNLGSWESFKSLRMISRNKLKNYLVEQYKIKPSALKNPALGSLVSLSKE